MPMAYPVVPRYEKYGIRRRLCGDYLIFYVIREQVVSIVHVCHGSQDYETLLFPTG